MVCDADWQKEVGSLMPDTADPWDAFPDSPPKDEWDAFPDAPPSHQPSTSFEPNRSVPTQGELPPVQAKMSGLPKDEQGGVDESVFWIKNRARGYDRAFVPNAKYEGENDVAGAEKDWNFSHPDQKWTPQHSEFYKRQVNAYNAADKMVSEGAANHASAISAAVKVPAEDRELVLEAVHDIASREEKAPLLPRAGGAIVGGALNMFDTARRWTGSSEAPDKERFADRLYKVWSSASPYNKPDAPWYERGIVGAAGMAPSLYGAGKASEVAGSGVALLGGGTKAVKAASVLGGAASFFPGMYDDAYDLALDANMTPRAASWVALTSATAQSLLFVGVGSEALGKGLSAAAIEKLGGKEAVAKVFNNALIKSGAKYGSSVASGSGMMGGASAIKEAIQETGQWASGQGVPEAGKILRAGWEGTKQGLESMPFLAAPGVIDQHGTGKAGNGDPAKLPDTDDVSRQHWEDAGYGKSKQGQNQEYRNSVRDAHKATVAANDASESKQAPGATSDAPTQNKADSGPSAASESPLRPGDPNVQDQEASPPQGETAQVAKEGVQAPGEEAAVGNGQDRPDANAGVGDEQDDNKKKAGRRPLKSKGDAVKGEAANWKDINSYRDYLKSIGYSDKDADEKIAQSTSFGSPERAALEKKPLVPSQKPETPADRAALTKANKEEDRAQAAQDVANGKIIPEAVKYAPLHELPVAAKKAMQQWAQGALDAENAKAKPDKAKVGPLQKIIDDAGRDVGPGVENMKEKLAKQAVSYQRPIFRDKSIEKQGQGYQEMEDNRDPVAKPLMADPETRDKMLDQSIASVRSGQPDELAQRLSELLGTPFDDPEDTISHINTLRDKGHAEAKPEGQDDFALQPTPQGKPEAWKGADHGKEVQKTMLSKEGAPGQQDLFNTEGSEPEPNVFHAMLLPPGAAKDLEIAAEAVGKVGKGLAEAFNPTQAGGESKAMAGNVRERAAKLALQHEQAKALLDQFGQVAAKLPQQQQYDFIHAIEVPKAAKPAWWNTKHDAAALAMRTLLDEARGRVQALGKGNLDKFIKDYFPHIWKDKAKAEEIFGKRPLEGSKSFLKKRTIPTTKEGLALGLEPITSNPVDLTLLKLHEMNRYVMGQQVLQEGKDSGYIKLVHGPKDKPAGWVKINDKIGEVFQRRPTTNPDGSKGPPELLKRGDYYAHPDAARVLNNYLSPGLVGNPVYDAIRFAGNAMNMAQLGLSGFHVTGTTINAIVSRSALAAKMLVEGHPLESVKMGLKAWTAPVSTLLGGSKVLEEALHPGSVGGDFAAIVDGLQAGGFRTRQSQMYRIGKEATTFWDGFRKALREGRPSAAIQGPLALIEQASRPMMEVYIPRMKLGVMADMARYELSKLPAGADRAQMRDVMGKVVDSVDNRMGQLIYDNLFWNKSLKDMGTILTRSMGWNLGTFRELGGGIRDLGKVPVDLLNGRNPKLTHAASYTLALPFVTGIMGAAMNFMYTGHGPRSLPDFFHIPTGQLDADGNEKKVELATYMRDLGSWFKHLLKGDPVGWLSQDIPRTAISKTHPLLAAVSQMANNRDFYYHPIRNENDPQVEQVKQLGTYIAEQFLPFSIRNMQELTEGKGRNKTTRARTIGEKAASLIGITPVPNEPKPKGSSDSSSGHDSFKPFK
jgi:hypothetical protein